MNAQFQRILLVDDDPDERFLTSHTLAKIGAAGATVNVVESGDEAIAYMIGEGKFADRRQFPFPSVVITDLNMEHGDGFDVLEFMQRNPGWSVVPRIVLSTSDDDDDVRTAFVLGASAFHQKPIQGAAAEKLLRTILEYWATSLVPPVDETGRLLVTESHGRAGARYPQLSGEVSMKRVAGQRAEPKASRREN